MVVQFVCIFRVLARASMMLVDRQIHQHLCMCACWRMCQCAPVHAEEQRDVRTWEGKQTNGSRERSSEQEIMIAMGEVWSCVGNGNGQETKKSNERSMVRKRTRMKRRCIPLQINIFCFYLKAEERE